MTREEYKLTAFENMLETISGPNAKAIARGYRK
jgi:hypothetical protein